MQGEGEREREKRERNKWKWNGANFRMVTHENTMVQRLTGTFQVLICTFSSSVSLKECGFSGHGGQNMT